MKLSFNKSLVGGGDKYLLHLSPPFPYGIRYKKNGVSQDYYFVCNWRGDVVQIYKENGALHASYEYDAWGNVLSVRSANGAIISSTYNIATINPLRYRGYYYDTETGMYYLKSRYYDPATKRFLNADGLVSSSIENVAKNMFTYCLNNPVIYVDSEGNCPYKPTSYDFYRLNHGLPAADCTCKNYKVPTTLNVANQDKTEERALAAMESVGFLLTDRWIDSLLSELSISSITTNILLDSVKGLSNSMGIASAMQLIFQIAWDFDEYNEKGNRSFLKAAVIDAGCTFAAVGIGVLMLSGGPTTAVVICSVALGYISANIADELKRKYIE